MENKIVGRVQEIKILNKMLASNKAEFLAIYGRRRVGKTYLIRQYFKNKPCYYFQITGVKNGSMKEQLYEFTRAIENTFYQSGITLKEPNTWMKAFELLTNTIAEYATKKKIVLFFDEIPWLATRRSRFLEALDYYWNTKWSEGKNIKLIVCGSAASWIIKNIVNNRGGLHNRITAKVRLDPFTLSEAKEFLQYLNVKLNDKQILQLYMSMGGIPQYLMQVEHGLSAVQNIDALCFTKNGALFEEYKNLIPSLFNDPQLYDGLLRIIANHRYGIERSELLEKSKHESGGRFNLRLIELEEAGFIVSFRPYGHLKRGTFYRIIDEYTLFYINWIEPITQSIRHQKNTRGYWDELSKSPAWQSWSGYAFEAVCYKHIDNIRTALNIPASSVDGTWKYVPKRESKEQGAQIDLLFDRKDGVITICEIKFNDRPFVIDKAYSNVLQTKINVFKRQTQTGKQIFLTFITAAGIKNTSYANELVSNQSVLEDLFKAN